MNYRIAAFVPLLTACLMPMAGFAADQNGCYWVQGSAPGPTRLIFSLPENQIAMDAPVGTMIGTTVERLGLPSPRPKFACVNDSRQGDLHTMYYRAINKMPMASLAGGLAHVALPVPEDKIIQTNIPGVGVSVRMRVTVDGTSTQSPEFILQSGTEARVPFVSVRSHNHRAVLYTGDHLYSVTLIKTGQIPVGQHQFDPGTEIFHSIIDQPLPGLSEVLTFSLAGNLVSSGCSTSPNPITPNPVELGEFEAKNFENAGSASPPVPFELNLTGCVPPAQGTPPNVYIALTPTNGSATIDGPAGTFSLGAGSSGGGVAFQLLDSTGMAPLALDTKVPLRTLPTGDASWPFNVRLIKHTGDVTPGSLAGALRFDVTYE